MYEHLRGGLRNQIPKFQNPSGPILLTQELFKMLLAKIPTGNPYIDLNSGQLITIAPQPNLQLRIEDDWQQFLHTDNMGQPIPKEQWALFDLQRRYKTDLSDDGSGDDGSDDGSGDGTNGDNKKSKIKQLLNKGLNSAKKYLALNAGQLANLGLNAANAWATSGVEQGGFMNGINGASNLVKNLPGIGEKASMLLGTLTTVNKLGGRSIDKYQVDLNLMANMGGSYGGFSDLALRAADATGKNYGFFNGGGYGKAKRLKNEAIRLENIVSDINSTSQDQLAMAGNDLNYTRYLFALNGGLNTTLMRAAKFGSKLERIRRITSKKLEEPIEEFAEDLWEPQLFLSGGKTLKVDAITGAAPKITFESWYASVPRDRISDNYDLKKAFEVLPFSELEAWRTSSVKDLIDGKNHLRSIYKLPNGEYEFLKLGNELTNPEVHWETDTYHSGENGLKNTHDLVFEGDRYFYRKKKFKEGGTIEENIEEDIFLEDSWEPLLLLNGNKIRTIQELIEYAKLLNPRFILRLSEPPRGIDFIDDSGKKSRGSHYLESAGEYVIPRILEVDGELKFFNHLDAVDRALETGNFLKMSPSEAIIFAELYKLGWPEFFNLFLKGGNLSDKLNETDKLEETNQKNIIPDGALHKEKHHMENSEDLTKKGIPVIDNDGVQLAEIERDEIVFTLEVTKKLEDLYKKYYDLETSKKDDLAIEAGKILVYEILYNTIDKTGLISKCKEGGKLNET